MTSPNYAPLAAMNPPKGTRPVPANARIEDLQVDQAYQRDLPNESITLIRRIAKDFDWTLCQPLIVARRGAQLFVVDGQHRLAAAKLRGDILDLPCVIIESEGIEHEAQTFVALNRARRPLTPFAVWRAALAAGDPSAVKLQALVDAVGLHLVGANGGQAMHVGDINNVGSLRTHLARYGEDATASALDVIAKSFNGQVQPHSGSTFTAVSRLMREFSIVPLKLIAVLRTRTQPRWHAAALQRAAETGVDRGLAYVAVLRDAYFGPKVDAPKGGVTPPAAVAAPVAPIPAKRRSFEETLAAVANGAPLTKVIPVRRPDPVVSGASSLA